MDSICGSNDLVVIPLEFVSEGDETNYIRMEDHPVDDEKKNEEYLKFLVDEEYKRNHRRIPMWVKAGRRLMREKFGKEKYEQLRERFIREYITEYIENNRK